MKIKIDIPGYHVAYATVLKTLPVLQGDMVLKYDFEDNGPILSFYYMSAKHYVQFPNSNVSFLIGEYQDTDDFGAVKYMSLCEELPMHVKQENQQSSFRYINYENYVKIAKLRDEEPYSFKKYLAIIDVEVLNSLWQDELK